MQEEKPKIKKGIWEKDSDEQQEDKSKILRNQHLSASKQQKINMEEVQKNKIQQKQQMQEKIERLIPLQAPKKLQIVAISDTHANFKILQQIATNLKGDIFIHAGDFTHHGRQEHFKKFLKILDCLRFDHKIVIAGNHEIMMDNGLMTQNKKKKYLQSYPCSMTRQTILQSLRDRCIYLQHQSVVVSGVKIFGSPYTPTYCRSAFQYSMELDDKLWSEVPKEVDIMVTHCPPYGILDKSNKGKSAGSKALKIISQLRKPKIHIFGHIHQAQGMEKIGQTLYVNVARQPTRLIFQK